MALDWRSPQIRLGSLSASAQSPPPGCTVTYAIEIGYTNPQDTSQSLSLTLGARSGSSATLETIGGAATDTVSLSTTFWLSDSADSGQLEFSYLRGSPEGTLSAGITCCTNVHEINRELIGGAFLFFASVAANDDGSCTITPSLF